MTMREKQLITERERVNNCFYEWMQIYNWVTTKAPLERSSFHRSIGTPLALDPHFHRVLPIVPSSYTDGRRSSDRQRTTDISEILVAQLLTTTSFSSGHCDTDWRTILSERENRRIIRRGRSDKIIIDGLAFKVRNGSMEQSLFLELCKVQKARRIHGQTPPWQVKCSMAITEWKVNH